MFQRRYQAARKQAYHRGISVMGPTPVHSINKQTNSYGSIPCDKTEGLTQSTVCQSAKRFPDISKEQSGFCLGSENRNRKEERAFEVNMEEEV